MESGNGRPTTPIRPQPVLKRAAVCALTGFALLVATAQGEKIYYYHNDHLDTPQFMTDESQNMVWKSGKHPFGANPPEVALVDNRLRFPGQYYDGETGLHYNWNRYYEPATGRYVTSDPRGLTAGLNTYSYVGANPNSFIDPRGLELWRGGDIGKSGSVLIENGNFVPGFSRQNYVCDPPMEPFSSNPCTLQCCVKHDECFERNKCNSSSWRGNFLGTAGTCQACNQQAIACFVRNLGREPDCEGQCLPDIGSPGLPGGIP